MVLDGWLAEGGIGCDELRNDGRELLPATTEITRTALTVRLAVRLAVRSYPVRRGARALSWVADRIVATAGKVLSPPQIAGAFDRECWAGGLSFLSFSSFLRMRVRLSSER